MIKGGTSSISCNYCREGVKMKKYHYYIDKLFETVINRRVKINDTKITIGRAVKYTMNQVKVFYKLACFLN